MPPRHLKLLPHRRLQPGSPLSEHPGGSSHAAPADVAPVARVRAWRALSDRVLVPAAGTATMWLLSGQDAKAAVLAFVAFFASSHILPPRQSWAPLLPLMRSPLHATKPLLGVLLLMLIEWATSMPLLHLWQYLVLFAACAAAGMIPHIPIPRAWRPESTINLAVIGSTRAAVDLSRELRLAGIPDYQVVGRVAIEAREQDRDAEVPTLGELPQLREIVERNGIQLLVMTGEVPRYLVFDEISRTCLHLPVRLWELSGFYEDVFGHVAVAEINASWFQYIMHPKFRAVTPAYKRALDLVVATVAGLAFLPIVAVCALLIRRDGGPALFKQVRVGEGGRLFTIYKLRTMTVESDSTMAWAVADDVRVTKIGRFLRKTHIDEAPQLLNVLKGEMTLIGPRPEQPTFVEQLEESVPFYQRRHLLKPGITGWAQVRCGYSGSELGSAWKLSHDLYYLKHRSFALDLAILGETLRTLVADPQYSLEPPASFLQTQSAAAAASPQPARKVEPHLPAAASD